MTLSTQYLHSTPLVGMAAPGMVLVPLIINTLHTRTNLLRNNPRAAAPLQVQLHFSLDTYHSVLECGFEVLKT